MPASAKPQPFPVSRQPIIAKPQPLPLRSVLHAEVLGLDPATLKAIIAARRIDGRLLSEEELAAARAALARVAGGSK